MAEDDSGERDAFQSRCNWRLWRACRLLCGGLCLLQHTGRLSSTNVYLLLSVMQRWLPLSALEYSQSGPLGVAQKVA